MKLIEQFFAGVSQGRTVKDLLSVIKEINGFVYSFIGQLIDKTDGRDTFQGTLAVTLERQIFIYSGTFWSDGCLYVSKILTPKLQIEKEIISYQIGLSLKTAVLDNRCEINVVDNSHVEIPSCRIELPIIPMKTPRVLCPDGEYVQVELDSLQTKKEIITTIEDISIVACYRNFLFRNEDGSIIDATLRIDQQAKVINWVFIGILGVSASTKLTVDVHLFVNWFKGRSHINLLHALNISRSSFSGN